MCSAVRLALSPTSSAAAAAGTAAAAAAAPSPSSGNEQESTKQAHLNGNNTDNQRREASESKLAPTAARSHEVDGGREAQDARVALRRLRGRAFRWRGGSCCGGESKRRAMALKASAAQRRGRFELGLALFVALTAASLCLLASAAPEATSGGGGGQTEPASAAAAAPADLSSLPATSATTATMLAEQPTVTMRDASHNNEDNESGQQTNQTNKLKPVNFTLVNEIFEATLSDDEVVSRWREMDFQLQSGMKSILKMIFPQIVSISQDAKVSGDCSGGILKWILSLRNMRSWAIKMLDATGKPTSGIFSGSLTMFGNYRQCLGIRAPDEDEIEITDQFEEYFRGQYCVLNLRPWLPAKRPFYHLNSTIEPLIRKGYKYYEKNLYDELAEIAMAFNFVDIRMDLCVPSTCSVADIQRVAEMLSKKLEMRAKVMRCDKEPQDNSFFSDFDTTTYVWLAFPIMMISLALVATILLACGVGGRAKSKRSANFGANQAQQSSMEEQSSKLRKLLETLSIVSAANDRLRPSDEQMVTAGEQAVSNDPLSFEQKPMPLYGLRSIFIFWFVIVQMTVELKYQYLRESLILRDMIIGYWPFQIIVNSVLLFDSLILITAFTYSYTCLETTLTGLIRYIVDKFVRLVPSIVTLIAITIVTPLLNVESPVWRNFVEEQATVCKSSGYINLFFLQNFISYNKICLPHTWLFCVEMQLTVLSIPLVLLLKKSFFSAEDLAITQDPSTTGNKGCSSCCSLKTTLMQMLKSRVGLVSSALITLGFLVNFLTVYVNDLPPTWFYTFPDVAQKDYYFGFYLTKTWTHLSVFLVGLLAGHLCRSGLQLRNTRVFKDIEMGPASRETNQQQRQQRQQQQQVGSDQTSSSTSSSLSSSSPTPSNSVRTIEQHSNQQHQKVGKNHSDSTLAIMALDSNACDDSSAEERQSSRSGGGRSGKHSTITSAMVQLAALICMFAIIFSTFNWSTQAGPTPFVAALYDAGSRLIWSLALVGLMLQLCLPDSHTGRFSLVARMLSHRVCILLGRFSLLAYLISPYVNTFVLAVEEQSLFPSLFIIFHVIVGNIVITYSLAFIFAIVIEQPVRRLANLIVSGFMYM